jgi:hypothetical protein
MQKKINFNPFRIPYYIFLFLTIFSVGLLSANFVEATDYVRYVDTDISDEYYGSASPDCNDYSPNLGVCGGGNAKAYRSLRDVNKFFNTLNSSDTAVVYFKRGNIWTYSSNDDIIKINCSNITIDAFGIGEKPIFDGNSQYPMGVTKSGIPYMYAIMVGDQAGHKISNVYIRNLRIQNMSPGGGVFFAGTGSSNGYFTSSGSVENCELYNIGWSGIVIYRVPNAFGSEHAIKIEFNHLDNLMTYQRQGAQGIQSNDGYSYGHECRYNLVERANNSGIGVGGFSITEYNFISDCDGPSIYIGHAQGGGSNFNKIVRYNICLEKSGGKYPGHTEIRIDDEKSVGDNTNTEIEVYGNIVVGGYAGISIRNNPTDGKEWSPFGLVKIYNNTLIDNKYNMLTKFNERFKNVVIKNNALIINSDAESTSNHLVAWSVGNWQNWNWGPNFYSGGNLPNLPFYNVNVDEAKKDSLLKKTKDWKNITSLNDFSFSDLCPIEGSPLVDNPKAHSISKNSGYQNNFLTSGTEYKNLPASFKILKANQEEQGKYWDFGAIIFNYGDNSSQALPYAPTGIKAFAAKKF